MKASYAAFLAAPVVATVLAWIDGMAAVRMELPATIALTYFASIFLGLAVILYDLAAPPEVKRGSSEDDYVYEVARQRAMERAEIGAVGKAPEKLELIEAWRVADSSRPIVRLVASAAVGRAAGCAFVAAFLQFRVVAVSFLAS